MTNEEIERVWLCGYSGRDDTSRVDATASKTKATRNGGRATDQKILDEALAVVKAAGYRVSKPKTPKHKDRVGPTFVCEFADGTTTRMSTYTSLEKLDWGRGERLSQAAYQSRWRTRTRAQYRKRTGKPCLVDLVAPVPPAIVSARFEQEGKVRLNAIAGARHERDITPAMALRRGSRQRLLPRPLEV